MSQKEFQRVKVIENAAGERKCVVAACFPFWDSSVLG